jgi:hypothetical protein
MQWYEVGENCLLRSFITYSSASIIRMVRSRRMRWTGHVECMGENRYLYRILVQESKGKYH